MTVPLGPTYTGRCVYCGQTVVISDTNAKLGISCHDRDGNPCHMKCYLQFNKPQVLDLDSPIGQTRYPWMYGGKT